jgi:hypothetical protein
MYLVFNTPNFLFNVDVKENIINYIMAELIKFHYNQTNNYLITNSSIEDEITGNGSEPYRSDFSSVLLPALAAEAESCNKITVRQTGSKGAEKEVSTIFSESGTISDGKVPCNKISYDQREIDINLLNELVNDTSVNPSLISQSINSNIFNQKKES